MGNGPDPKVRRLMAEYELDDLGEELERRWTDPDDPAGLRQLAHDVNRRLLETELAEHGESPLAGEVENIYELLSDDNVSSGERSQARSRLEHHGIDVETLTTDFVSRQAIHTYLTKYRDVDPPTENRGAGERREDSRETIQKLQGRLERVTSSILSSLGNAGVLDLGNISVLVNVRVHCAECGTRTNVQDLFDAGGCECSGD